jgi:hypothetical protein
MSETIVRLQPWRPANGTEGRIFADWCCDNCLRDHQGHIGNFENGCPIIVTALTDIAKEWWCDVIEPYTVQAYGCDKYEPDGCRDALTEENNE